jgi:hypothetical protein
MHYVVMFMNAISGTQPAAAYYSMLQQLIIVDKVN